MGPNQNVISRDDSVPELPPAGCRVGFREFFVFSTASPRLGGKLATTDNTKW